MKCALLCILSSLFCIGIAADNCHCSNASLCRPIEGKSSSWEVVGFTYGAASSNYELFDWDKLTTLVVFSIHTDVIDDIVCHAHERHVKVHLLLHVSNDQLTNDQLRNAYVQDTMKLVEKYHFDGVNVDYEEHVKVNGSEYNGLTQLMKDLRIALTKKNHLYEISMDYVYCPFCLSTKTYDISKIQHFVDYFVLMDYNLQGTGNDHKDGPYLCASLANSPLSTVRRGAVEFLEAGFKPKQIVIAFPWYGNHYPCVKYNVTTQACYTKCQDRWKGGVTLRYCTIMRLFRQNATSSRMWNNITKTPLFNYLQDKEMLWQVNYDDPESLKLKYDLSQNLQFRGVGLWNIDFLNYSNDEVAVSDRKKMWSVIPG